MLISFQFNRKVNTSIDTYAHSAQVLLIVWSEIAVLQILKEFHSYVCIYQYIS